uniref:Uncharacterized protein n=1 Tax=Romanomermis culicivorax TaxID=13658 RepID=A0A915IC91_ROMCU
MHLSPLSSKSPPGVLALSLSISETASVSKALSAMRHNLIESSSDFREVLEIFDTIDIVSEKLNNNESDHKLRARVTLLAPMTGKGERESVVVNKNSNIEWSFGLRVDQKRALTFKYQLEYPATWSVKLFDQPNTRRPLPKRYCQTLSKMCGFIE